METLALPDVGADTTTRPVGRVVTGVSVLADEVTIHGGGTPVASLSYPQASSSASETSASYSTRRPGSRR